MTTIPDADKLSYYNDLFNCKDLTAFTHSIIKQMPVYGVSQSKFYICSYHTPTAGVANSHNYFLTKVYFYHKTPKEIYSTEKVTDAGPRTMAHADAEIKVLTLLRPLIDNHVTPCILRMDYHKICHGVASNTCTKNNLMRDDGEINMCEYLNLVNNGLAHDKYAFLVLEMCDITLNTYLHNIVDAPIAVAIFKSIIFQVVHAFYVIKRAYPGFRHGDLHTDNVMISIDHDFKYDARDQRYIVFIIDKVKYYVPYFGITPKIIDFGYTIIPEADVISNVVDDRIIMFKRSENDLLLLFHYINYTLETHPKKNLSRIKELLRALEPNMSYVHYLTESIRANASIIPSYEDMIKNKVWRDYRTVQKKVIATYGHAT